MTEPHEEMIYRTFKPEVNNILKLYSSHIEEAVNYGTHLLLWKSENPEDQSGVSNLFLKYFLDLLDSLSILIKNGSREASIIILRSLFEIHLYIQFICEKHTYLRALSFIVVETLNQIKDLNKYDTKTEIGKNLQNIITKEPWSANLSNINFDDLAKERKRLNEFLEATYFKDVLKEYELVKLNNKNKNKKINWYNLFDGQSNIELLARSLDKYPVYEILYRKWSKATHGLNIIEDKLIEKDDGSSIYRPLREPTGLMLLSKYGCNFSINTFGNFIKCRHSNRFEEYEKWQKKFIDDFSFDLDHEYITFQR